MPLSGLPGAVAATAVAAVVGFGLHRYGSRESRSWAVSAAAWVFFGGVGYSFDLPGWLLLIGFLAVPMLLHRNAKSRLQSAADSLAEVTVPGAGFSLKKKSGLAGKVVGVWDAGGWTADGAGEAKPIVLSLEFEGETEDQYRVLLRGKTSKAAGTASSRILTLIDS